MAPAWDGYALDELERVMGGAAALRHPAHAPRLAGGEFDALRALPRDVRRTLVGAQLLTAVGELPDVAGDVIAARVPAVRNVDDAVHWWVAACLAMIRHRRRVAHWRRHDVLAHREGFGTYWGYRSDYLRARARQVAA